MLSLESVFGNVFIEEDEEFCDLGEPPWPLPLGQFVEYLLGPVFTGEKSDTTGLLSHLLLQKPQPQHAGSIVNTNHQHLAWCEWLIPSSHKELVQH